MNSAGEFYQSASEFVAAADQFQQARDISRLDRLREARLKLVRALLKLRSASAHDAIAATLPAIIAACVRSNVRVHPRTSAENELFTRCLEHLKPWRPEQDPGQGIAACLLSWHAFELEFVPPIASLPPVIKAAWLHFLFECPPAFAGMNDADKLAFYLGQLGERIYEYLTHDPSSPQEVIAAFNRSNIFVQGYFNEQNMRHTMRTRGAIIEKIMEHGGATLDQLRVWRPAIARPRIGFIALHLADGTETTFLASHLERLDRRRYEVRLYCMSEPAGKIGNLCTSWVDAFVRLPGQIEHAVRGLRLENLDMAVFCTNLTAVVHPVTRIAAHRIAPIQVTTVASPVTTGLRNIDVFISGEANETSGSADHYTERLACMTGAVNCYPFQYILEALPDPGWTSRQMFGVPEECPLFFSSANFFKILPELSQQWISILQQVPNSYLLLMPFNPNWLPNYPVDSLMLRLNKQASEAGLPRDRIRVAAQVPTIAHLHKIIALTDVYLDAFPFSGACSIFDPLYVGIPVVARMGRVSRSRHSKAILEDAGLGAWVTPDEASYVQAAVELGSNPDKRRAAREQLARAREAGLQLGDTDAYAAKLMPLLDGVLSEWNERFEALRRADPVDLSRRIDQLSREVGKRVPSFTDRDLVCTVVVPYLRNGGTRRLIDVGACFGALAEPFLVEGWRAVMFEPDARCHQALGAFANKYAGRVILEKAAVVAGQQATTGFHVASVTGLSGLSNSPFASDVGVIEVAGISLSAYLTKKGWENADFIKIDAEGRDLDILRSMDFKAISPRLESLTE